MQQTNELQKLVEAVNKYRDIHSICESVPPANLKDWQKTKLHDAYVNMLIVCDAVQSSGLTKRAADGAGTLPESGEYFVEYVESNIVRLTPRR